jgi:hypothetical protein
MLFVLLYDLVHVSGVEGVLIPRSKMHTCGNKGREGGGGGVGVGWGGGGGGLVGLLHHSQRKGDLCAGGPRQALRQPQQLQKHS